MQEGRPSPCVVGLYTITLMYEIINNEEYNIDKKSEINNKITSIALEGRVTYATLTNDQLE